jgi:hypothetical protein
LGIEAARSTVRAGGGCPMPPPAAPLHSTPLPPPPLPARLLQHPPVARALCAVGFGARLVRLLVPFGLCGFCAPVFIVPSPRHLLRILLSPLKTCPVGPASAAHEVWVRGGGKGEAPGYSSPSVCGMRAFPLPPPRPQIIRELMATYTNYGIELDKRHLTVLADTMTYRGTVLGITRFGIEKMKDSVLGNASFEKTPDHLFNASVGCVCEVGGGGYEEKAWCVRVCWGGGAFCACLRCMRGWWLRSRAKSPGAVARRTLPRLFSFVLRCLFLWLPFRCRGVAGDRGGGGGACVQLHSKVDTVEGVSACIIMGSPMELGTGAFKLMRSVPQPDDPPLHRQSFLLA